MAVGKELSYKQFRNDTANRAIGYDGSGVATLISTFAVSTVGLVPAPAGGDTTKFLRGDGTWQSITGTGTVTSIDVSGGSTGLSFSGGPITSSGTITLAGTLAAVNGGTGINSYAIGDILYASSTTALSKLVAAASGNALLSGTTPSWGKIGLTTHVSGILPTANGGLGVALTDPGADRLLFWDESANAHAYLTLGTNLSITGTTLDAAGGGGGGTWGSITGTLSDQLDLDAALDAKQPLDATLTSLAAFATNGLMARTGVDTFAGRTITGTSNRIVVNAGDGVSGNPVINTGVNIVDMTVSNIYTSGANQIFSHSGTTAGIRIAEAGGSPPSVPGDGDLWHITNTDIYAQINGQAMALTRPVQSTQTGTTYTLTEADRNKIIYLTNSSPVTVTGANLTTGFLVTLVKVGTGNVIFSPDTGLTLESSDTTILMQYGSATFIKKSSTVWTGFGALGDVAGLTNTAGVDELAKSDGTNLEASGLFSTSDGNILLGATTDAGTQRAIDAQGSASNVQLLISAKGSAVLQLKGSSIAFVDTASNRLDIVPATSTLSSTKSGTDRSLRLVAPAGSVTANNGDHINLDAGDAYSLSGNGNGGNVIITCGLPTGSGTPGSIYIDTASGYLIIPTIPTSSAGLPSGAIWSNSNVLTRVP